MMLTLQTYGKKNVCRLQIQKQLLAEFSCFREDLPTGESIATTSIEYIHQ